MSEFVPFPKIPRLNTGCTVTEKIDGTNAAVVIDADGNITAQSRNRIITPGKLTDNAGFAGWVEANKEDLAKLGEGVHFGEWWGIGIQRGYGLAEKRFSLFNAQRWTLNTLRPECCSVVPVLYEGDFDTAKLNAVQTMLGATGSVAAPGFMNPEGTIVFVHTSRQMFKVPFDTQHKTQLAAA